MLRWNRQTVLRLLVGLLAYGFVLYRLAQADWALLRQAFAQGEGWPLLAMLLALGLMPAVWAVEALKWGRATRGFMPTSFGQRWRTVGYGVAVGMLTPNRMGEPLGRLAQVPAGHRGSALAASVWCAMSQQLATLLFGAIALVFGDLMPHLGAPWGRMLGLALGAMALLAAGLLLAMMRYDRLLDWLQRRRWVQRLLGADERLAMPLAAPTALSIVGLSMFKYLIFSSQYVLLLWAFGVDAPLASLYAGVALSYLFVTFVPSVAATELGVRLGAALAIIGPLSPNHGGVAAAALALWAINMALPALMAVWFRWSK